MTETERLRCNATDIGGLNLCDRNRIEEVGFDRWLDEVCNAPPPISLKHAAEVSEPRKSKRKTRRNCVRCGGSFLAKRADARYCSVKCRIRACRYPDSRSETDNLKLASGTRINTGLNDVDLQLTASYAPQAQLQINARQNAL
jgi:ribosomal protein S27AE